MVIVLGKLYVFVYGTLRRQEPYHYLLRNAQLIATTQTQPEFTLLDLGEYPGMSLGGTTAVTGEIYEITTTLLSLLDRYEDYPQLYNRQQILLQDGNRAITYILRPPFQNHPIIESGDWKKKQKSLPQAVPPSTAPHDN